MGSIHPEGLSHKYDLDVSPNSSSTMASFTFSGDVEDDKNTGATLHHGEVWMEEGEEKWEVEAPTSSPHHRPCMGCH